MSSEQQERNKENTCPYVPGDLTDEKHRLPSHDSLAQNRYQNNTDDSGNGYPRYREDFSKPLPEIKNKTIPRDEVEAECQNHKRMAEHNYICNGIKEAVRKKTPSPIIAAIKNFQLAKKLHRENLEHDPLPDTITNSKYRRLQMQRSQKDPGLALNDDNYATGIGWKGYPGYGPTRCTKLKVYRPKTCGHTDKHEIKNDGRPSSVTSFDRKWRFIRQRKVTPIELAICWDLTPENPKDEPKRTPHIDGSNGSLAPAVFSLVHTPKEEDSRKSSITTECSHHTEPIFEKGPIRSPDEKDFVLDRPKTSHPQETKRRTSRDSVQSEESLSKKRAKSAYNLSNNRHDDKKEKQSCSRCSHEEVHQSTPNLSEHGGSYNKKIKNSRTCTACELKKLSLKDRRPKNINNEFKMAFKAGVPQKCVSKTSYNRNARCNFTVPKQKDPYSPKNYAIRSLAPPFSLQKDKREDYPEHWRLATVYQHSYKPIHSRKRPLLATVNVYLVFDLVVCSFSVNILSPMANIEELVDEEELYRDVEDETYVLKNLDIEDEYEYESDLEDSLYFDEEEGKYQKPNPQNSSNKVSTYQPYENLFKKYTNKINVDKYEIQSLPSHATNLLMASEKRMENEKIRTKDKHDRATAEQVMDPRTRMILFKLLSKNFISEINGCISTGKEANVYHASSERGQLAIKIYKTSILVFKDRDKYVSGEFRFRHGYCRHNPRKMVRTWAEKEMRNLTRMHSNGLNVPEPILLRSHVLLMGFIGKDGWPAPKLKDVELSQSKAREIYRDVVVTMWKLYNQCKLVHADLSEFNILYLNGEICIIDVSQSVEHDHPHALDFLRKDCTNVTDFFKKKEVATMSIKDLFDFITDPTINESNMEECLEALSAKSAQRTEISSQEQVEEEVFKQAYIPKRLTEVIDFERDINQVKSGLANDLVYKTLVGLKADLSGTVQHPEILDRQDSSENSFDENSEEEQENESKFMNSSRPKHETLEEKKARKKAYFHIITILFLFWTLTIFENRLLELFTNTIMSN
ncbi:serine/threonine-protein kinase RIO1 [Asbolus verrucosus]|uniref:Serine/threonine-protein kinase RIO1 n=1 Tax=Asbolus verrucosus TaxID=1661398 RepID=A0A482VJE0_ASBVE|nr:serine/threonine-protein kinase RIO1 [Asbolus verrucosus]